MFRLLHADFARLCKSVTFWGCMAAAAIWGAVKVYYHHQKWTYIPVNDISAESVYLFGYNYVDGFSQLVLIMAVFAAMFIGTDYSQRTMRNKLVIGRSRAAVYLSNLTVCAAGSLFFNLSYVAGVTLMGLAFGGQYRFVGDEVGIILIIAAADIAVSAILTLMCMLISHKAVCTAAALIIFFVTPFIAETVCNEVREPEYNVRREYNEDKTSYSEIKTKNEKYLMGTKRFFYMALNNVSPLGQYQQLQMNDIYDISQYAGYPLLSLGVTAVSSAVGILVFRRKDIK